ncbi:alpha/beta fold hydrolase [Streptomyces sp. M10(2022)]
MAPGRVARRWVPRSHGLHTAAAGADPVLHRLRLRPARARGQRRLPVYAVEREVEDLAAVIEATGGDAVVFGGSSGAILALEAALAGVPMRKLALLEPPYWVEGFRRPEEDFTQKLQALLDQEKRGEAIEYFLAEHVGFPPEWIAQWRASPIWPANEALAHTLIYDTAVIGEGGSRSSGWPGST